MSTVTTYLGLTKPANLEQYNVALINTNADLIDAEVGAQRTHNKGDRSLLFKNAGFAWSGGSVPWDAGTLVVNTDTGISSQMSSPQPAFATAGSLSGTVKFTEPGLYIAQWKNIPGAEPGQSGYRVTMSGTWPGTPTGLQLILGQTQKQNASAFWESFIETAPFRVPTANLEIRFTGFQANGTTNIASIKLVQIGKF